MHNPWTRKRANDEVPAPVAVAVADFCRRAGAPATPSEVRDALSTLAADEDFRVRTLTDGEPAARPLGPYAVVDVLTGTAPTLAAQREACGYYQLLKGILAAEAAPRGRAAADARAPPGGVTPPRLEVAQAVAERQTGASQKPSAAELRHSAAATSVAGRIAPRRRPPRPSDSPPAVPRGRFTQLPSEQPLLEALEPPQLADLLTQHGHRPALLRALTSGRAPGISPQALDRALEQAGLLEHAAETERELVLSTLEEQRGAVGRAAWALGVRGGEFLAWAERLGVTVAVDRIRDRFRREALQPVHWTARLDLLGKRKYLQDLGVTADFERSVTEDLRRALAATEGAPEERTAVLANRLGVAPEALRRSLLRLHLLPGIAASTLPQPA